MNFICSVIDIFPESKWFNLLNLSILISGGKENNSDAFSTGEGTRQNASMNFFLKIVLEVSNFGHAFKCSGLDHKML